jgi:hypothetical protein
VGASFVLVEGEGAVPVDVVPGAGGGWQPTVRGRPAGAESPSAAAAWRAAALRAHAEHGRPAPPSPLLEHAFGAIRVRAPAPAAA